MSLPVPLEPGSTVQRSAFPALDLRWPADGSARTALSLFRET